MTKKEPQDNPARRWAALRELLGVYSGADSQLRLVWAGLLSADTELLLPAGLGLAWNELAVRLGTCLPVAALQQGTEVKVLKRGPLTVSEHQELRVLRELLPRWLELEQREGQDGLLAAEPPGLPEHLAHVMPTPAVPLTFGGSLGARLPRFADTAGPPAPSSPPALGSPSLADALEALMPEWLARNPGVPRAAYELTVGTTEVEVVVTIPPPAAPDESQAATGEGT